MSVISAIGNSSGIFVFDNIYSNAKISVIIFLFARWEGRTTTNEMVMVTYSCYKIEEYTFDQQLNS